MAFKLLTSLIIVLLLIGCTDTENCNECDLALKDYFNSTFTGNCTANAAQVNEMCKSNVAKQAVGIIRESCYEGFRKEAFCEPLGRDQVAFDVSVLQGRTIPNEVRVEISYSGGKIETLLDNGEFYNLTFNGFIFANVLIDVDLYDARTDELLFSATPKVTYDRLESHIQKNRVIQVEKDDTFGWRLFFFNWE